MVELVLSTTPGETECEKALWLAVNRNDTSYLASLLLDANYELTFIDRFHLAEYIRGNYRLPPGRRDGEHRHPILDTTPTKAQMATSAVRQAMAERRAAGARVRGEQAKLIERFATEYGADPKTVTNNIRKGR